VGQAKGCDDGNPCTTDGCDGLSGSCFHQPAPGTWCDDGDLCTTGDACQADGSCQGDAKSCTDTFVCTVDSCDPGTGECVHDDSTCQCLSDADCDDGSPCTSGACKLDGSCIQTPVAEGEACGPTPKAGACLEGTCGGIVQVAGGDRHYCALLASGEVRCWGLNNFGQLGLGSTIDRLDSPGETTQAVPLPEPALAITVGWVHSCVLLASHDVACWGWNGDGQLGAGDTEDLMDEPGEQPSAVFLDGATATSIAAGGKHTCAITSTGAVRCWGDNSAGQLGDGTTSDRLAAPGQHASTVDLGGTTAVALAAGDFFTCALTQAGQVRCWGLNNHGQLGAGSTDNLMDQPGETASTVGLGGAQVTTLAAGAAFVCALTTQGEVRCWGDNGLGQLGAGDTEDRMDEPGEEPSTVALGASATALAAHHHHACAILEDGTVRCWGWNPDGGLGAGHTMNLMDGPDEAPSVVPLGGHAATSLATAKQSGCAILESGQVRCWGWNNNGQLGVGSTQNAGDAPGTLPLAGSANIMGAPGSVCTTGSQCLSGACTGGLCTQ